MIPRTDFARHSFPEFISEIVIPNLYIPIVNNRVVDPTNFIRERRKKLKNVNFL